MNECVNEMRCDKKGWEENGMRITSVMFSLKVRVVVIPRRS